MPERSVLDVLRDVKGNYPGLPVILVSAQPEDQYAKRCLQEGAAAYISKDRAPEELAPATKTILACGRSIRPPIAEKQST